jgi:hypothetical protein
MMNATPATILANRPTPELINPTNAMSYSSRETGTAVDSRNIVYPWGYTIKSSTRRKNESS